MISLQTELEKISPASDSSISIMVNPNLSDFFFWHFHPELELVYLDGADGNRHIGDHFSRFHGSDLAFIGSNIPHLNFDFGIKTPYEKIVVHIKPDFLQHALVNTPELSAIQQLFHLSRFALAFGAKSKELIGKRLKNLHTLPHFQQFLELLELLQILAISNDWETLHDHPVSNRHTLKDQHRLKEVLSFIDHNYQRKIEIKEVAALSNLSNEAFCRYFKKMTRLTFTEFVNHYRIDKAKKLLLLDKNITEATFESGFESVSYFNRMFKKVTKENPLAFKRRHREALFPKS